MQQLMPLAELRALFRLQPAFRRVYLADLVNQLGEGGLLVLFPLLILQHTHDLGLAGLAFTGEILAFGLFSPLAGLWADRLEQKRLMQATLLVRAALLGALLLLLQLWPQALALALLISFALGACAAFFMPARAAFLRRLLEGEALEKALALEGTTHFLLRVLAPACFGLLAAYHPPALGLLLTMAAYLLAVALLAPAWVTGPQIANPEVHEAGAWKEGWRTIWASTRLREVVLLDVLLSLVGMAAFSLMLAFLQQDMHLSAQTNGWLLATTGVAGVVGTLLAQRLPQGRWLYPVLTVFIAMSYVLAPFAPALPALMGAWALRGLALGALCVRFSQAVAREAPAEKMGRVQAAWALACCFASTLGSLSCPWLLHHLGAGRAYLAFGLLLLVLATAHTLVLLRPWRLRATAKASATVA